MAAMPPSCSSFQASQPPTFQAFTLLLALLSVSALLRVSTLFALVVFVVVVGFRRPPRRARNAHGAPRSQSSPDFKRSKRIRAPTSVRCRSSPTKSAKRCVLPSRFYSCSCFCSCFCSCSWFWFWFCSFFVFVPAAQAHESDAPLRAAPLRRVKEDRMSDPPQSAPRAKPSVPRAFPFTAPKTILDRAGDDNLSKGLIDPFG
jgi:hypothetical protein